jgi:hypothetical protein
MTEFRLLTRAELETVPGMVDPIPSSLFAMGAVDDKGVAAAIGVFLVMHADPFWIREDLRQHGKLPLRLWEATLREIIYRRLGPELFVGMTEDNPGQPTEGLVERMCKVAGANEIKARFFVIPIEDSDGDVTADWGS